LVAIRPVTQRDVRERNIIKDGFPIIYPKAKVSFDLYPIKVTMPHVEDLQFDVRTIKFEGEESNDDWATLLDDISFAGVDDIFDGHLNGRSVPVKADTRSLGTVTGVEILGVSIEEPFKKRRYSIDFIDDAGQVHKDFPVVDLAFRHNADALIYE
jgi:hypothetical protein